MNSTIIEMQGVSLRYDRRVVLNDIDFSVRRGDFMAITGPNGGGKTSLLRSSYCHRQQGVSSTATPTDTR